MGTDLEFQRKVAGVGYFFLGEEAANRRKRVEAFTDRPGRARLPRGRLCIPVGHIESQCCEDERGASTWLTYRIRQYATAHLRH